jgi:hypothetical protein
VDDAVLVHTPDRFDGLNRNFGRGGQAEAVLWNGFPQSAQVCAQH